MTSMPSRTELAQYAANLAVQHVASQAAETAITNHTSLDEDDTVVYVGSNVIGMVVASRLKERTDAVVEIAANYIELKRVARQSKKNLKK